MDYDAGTGSSGTGNAYSFGSAGSTERAFGSVGSSGTGTVRWGFTYTNNTGVPITSLSVGYTGEQWRSAGSGATGGTHQLTFAYTTGDTPILTPGTYVSVPELGFNSPFNPSAPATALDGNASSYRTVFAPVTITLATPLAVGSKILIRWEDIDHGGNDHGLAIDDVSVQFFTSLPAQPTSLQRDGTAATYSQTDITVKWTDNASNETGYVLERNTVATPSDPNWTVVTTTAADVASFRDTPPAAAGGYFYRIKATNAAGSSPYAYNSDNALPVTYLNLAANYQSGRVNVNWETVSEQNNSYFSIERSTDANTYAAVGQLTGKGISNSRQSYVFTDESPAPGWSYYRLKQVDTDGTFAYSRPMAVLNEDNQAGTVLRLFPNPASDEVTLELNGKAPFNEVRVCNIVGQWLTLPINADRLDVSQLPAGLYLVDVKTEDGRMLRQRLMKQ